MSDLRIALFRGINVGGSNRVKMAALRSLVEGLGFGSAKTLLASGNLVFEAPGISAQQAAERIGAALAAELGVRCRVLGLEVAELRQIAAENPLGQGADNPSRLLISILADPADRVLLEPLLGLDWGRSALALGSRAAYQWCPDGLSQSELPDAVAKRLGDRVTGRNLATVEKLLALAEA